MLSSVQDPSRGPLNQESNSKISTEHSSNPYKSMYYWWRGEPFQNAPPSITVGMVGFSEIRSFASPIFARTRRSLGKLRLRFSRVCSVAAISVRALGRFAQRWPIREPSCAGRRQARKTGAGRTWILCGVRRFPVGFGVSCAIKTHGGLYIYIEVAWDSWISEFSRRERSIVLDVLTRGIVSNKQHKQDQTRLRVHKVPSHHDDVGESMIQTFCVSHVYSMQNSFLIPVWIRGAARAPPIL